MSGQKDQRRGHDGCEEGTAHTKYKQPLKLTEFCLLHSARDQEFVFCYIWHTHFFTQ